MASEPAGSGDIEIEVVLALPGYCHRRALVLPPGTTAGQALALSDLSRYLLPPAESQSLSLGIFGRKIGHEHILRHGDRLELYRPLHADPRERRRREVDARRARDRSER